MSHLVSVIIPAYNAEKHIAEALDSVLMQDVSDLEVIVVDDGSVDRTSEITQSYHSAIRYAHRDNSGNPAVARNDGIQLGDSRYIAFLDSDDVFLPDHLRRGIEILEHYPQVDLTFSNYEPFADGETQPQQDYFSRPHIDALLRSAAADLVPNARLFRKPITRQLVESNFVRTSSVIARRDMLEAAGGFPTHVYYAEDMALWIELCDRGHLFAALCEPTMRYRVRSDSISHDPSHRPELINFWRSFLSQERSPELMELAREKLFDNASSLGYHHRAQGSALEALRYYSVALRYGKRKEKLRPLLGISKIAPSRLLRSLGRYPGSATRDSFPEESK